MRTSAADVLGTIVRGRLAHQTEALSGQLAVVNVGDAGGEASANGHAPAVGLSYISKTPDAVLPLPATQTGCEFDSIEDAIKDFGA